MITVKVESGTATDRVQRAEAAIKKFNSRVIKSGLMVELKEREFYLKPSLRRHYEQ